jgi:hypothetical protein
LEWVSFDGAADEQRKGDMKIIQWNPLSPKTHYQKIRVTHDVFDGPADSLLCDAYCSHTLHEMPSPDA